MSDLDVRHYLGVYQTILRIHEEGITNPPDEIKMLVRTIVETLSQLPLDEVIIVDGERMMDSKGNIIAEFPD